jgi:hypothetical protein
MAARDEDGAGLGSARVLDGDEVQGVLTGAFYQAPPESGRMLKAERDVNAKAKPTHYKVICISMYTRDLEELDAKVAELKRRGWTKANKSQLIRLALASLDLDKLPTPQQ